MAMVDIDVDALRAYLLDYCGTAMFSGFPAAAFDVVDIERANGEELCCIAGVDKFGSVGCFLLDCAIRV